MTSGEAQNAYDEAPYAGQAYRHSSPDHLATIAWLFGLTSPEITSCRVLELGCASGNNIIPLADTFPEAEFVGIDRSARQIDAGQATIAHLGLRNITLQHANILDVDERWGQYDYIIAHGIFSWVPDGVREHILTIIRRNLAPNGVAFISYNINPGWRVLGMIRDALIFHTRRLTDARERMAAAIALLDLLADGKADYCVLPGAPVAAAANYVRSKLAKPGIDRDSYLLHEWLEEDNTAFYFSEFIERASRQGLQYLADARIADMLPYRLPQVVADSIGAIATDAVEAGQYLDFLRNHTFRQTLLCHAHAEVDRMLRPERVKSLHAASRATPILSPADDGPPSVEHFQGLDNTVFRTDHPVTTAAMAYLCEQWPQAVPFELLLAAAYRRLDTGPAPPDPSADAELLARNLLQGYIHSTELVSLHTHAPRVSSSASERPVAQPSARFDALREARVANVYHEMVELDPLSQALLPLLDGTRDHSSLAVALEMIAAEEAHPETALQPPPDGTPGDPTSQLDETLAYLVFAALLIA